jgi:hypothetical protein
MPRVITTVHNPAALAATCRALGLDPPVERAVRLDADEVFGWVVPLRGLRFPIVCDTLTGLIAYHPLDNAFARYAHLMRFILRVYDFQARLRREVSHPVRCLEVSRKDKTNAIGRTTEGRFLSRARRGPRSRRGVFAPTLCVSRSPCSTRVLERRPPFGSLVSCSAVHRR